MANGPFEGGWLVVDSWETRAAHDRFMETRVIPGTREARLTGPPQVDVMPVHGLIIEPSGAPA